MIFVAEFILVDGIAVDKSLILEMFKETEDDVTSRRFDFSTCVIDTAIFKNGIETKSWSELLMKFDFVNASQDVIFNRDDSWGVVHIGDVEEMSVIANNLIFNVGVEKER